MLLLFVHHCFLSLVRSMALKLKYSLISTLHVETWRMAHIQSISSNWRGIPFHWEPLLTCVCVGGEREIWFWIGSILKFKNQNDITNCGVTAPFHTWKIPCYTHNSSLSFLFPSQHVKTSFIPFLAAWYSFLSLNLGLVSALLMPCRQCFFVTPSAPCITYVVHENAYSLTRDFEEEMISS